MPKNEIFSTGVLTREPNTISAVVNIVNLDMHEEGEVIVEVWDWSSYDNPKTIPVLIGENIQVTFPYKLQPNNLAVMYADLNEASVDLYEIRIYYKGKNLIANCFGRSFPPYTSQEGNTVFQHQLVKVDFKKKI